MLGLNKEVVAKRLNSATAVGMSVCNSCAKCGGCGSRCVSTCKGCHDKDVKLDTVEEIYSQK